MRYSIYLFLLCASFLLFSCSDTSNKENNPSTKAILIKDDLGRMVSVPVQPNRILSLTPSITELLYAFTDTSRIAGRSVYCDYPADVVKKPAVNSYPADIERIVQLKPDLVLVKNGMISIQDLEKLDQLNIPVFVQKYDRIREIMQSVQTLIQITKGDSLKMKQWLSRLETDTAVNSTTKTFVVLASVTPIYVFGKQTFVSELAEQAGGLNAIQQTDNPYPAVDVEYFLRGNPDVLIFSEGTRPESFFEAYPVLKKINAYKNHQFYSVEPSVLSRPGSRLPVLKDTITAILSK